MDKYSVIMILIISIGLLLLFRSIYNLIYNVNSSKMLKVRRRQLQFKEKTNMSQKDMVDRITNPFIERYLKNTEIKNKKKTEIMLRDADVFDVFGTAENYIALDIMTKILGIVVFILFYNVSFKLAAVGGLVLFTGLSQTVKSTAKQRKETILMGFPDTIRYLYSYLSAGKTLVDAMEMAIEDVEPEWQKILSKFMSDFNTPGVGMNGAIDKIKDTVDIFEIREFFSFIKVKIDQGGKMKESFEMQAEKTDELFKSSMLKKIESRKIYAVVVQYPAIIAIMLLMSLPVIHGFVDGGIF